MSGVATPTQAAQKAPDNFQAPKFQVQTVLLNCSLSSLAGCCAVCFSHPLELTKTRLQLDGELAKLQKSDMQYRGWRHCVAHNWAKDGIAGLQRGLSMAIIREGIFNFFRIGLFDPSVRFLHPSSDPCPAYKKWVAGFGCGAIGGAIANPVDILKVRMQADGGLTGYQHTSHGPVVRMKQLLNEEGVRGLSRGLATNTVRGIVGPGTQLPAYNILKQKAVENGYNGQSPVTHIICSLISAAFSIACVNPVDIVRTRLYNQPFDEHGRGLRYSGGVDATLKIARSEGMLGFYKGALVHYARLGPHLTLVFLFLEQFKQMAHIN